jgi:hypothetical protein
VIEMNVGDDKIAYLLGAKAGLSQSFKKPGHSMCRVILDERGLVFFDEQISRREPRLEIIAVDEDRIAHGSILALC